MVFGIIGIVLGVVGLKMAKRVGVTGKGVAVGGLVTAVLGLLLGGAVIGGLSALVNDEQRLDQLQNQIDDLRDQVPSTDEVRQAPLLGSACSTDPLAGARTAPAVRAAAASSRRAPRRCLGGSCGPGPARGCGPSARRRG